IGLALVDARIARAGSRGSRTSLRIVLLLVDVAARLVLLMLQVAPLGARQFSVGLVAAFELADVALLFRHVPRLLARQLPGTHALLNAFALIMLTSIYVRIASTGVGLRRRQARQRGQHCHGYRGFHRCLLLLPWVGAGLRLLGSTTWQGGGG